MSTTATGRRSVLAAAAAAIAVVTLPSPAAAVSLGAGAFSAAEAALKRGSDEARQMLRGIPDDLVKPLRMDQKLLICNAYPSATPISATKNGKDMLGEEGAKGAIAFQECRSVPSQLQKQDRLDFDLHDVEVHGTFEVGDLPNSDAVLLLVLEKREHSPMLAFKSFAFPSATGRHDTQLAVINTFEGNATAPRLKMEDYIAPAAPGDAKKIVARRTEQLNFNRVYSVEEGQYTASILDDNSNPSTASAGKVLKLAKANNYVVLRTPSMDGPGEETLVVYGENSLRSGAVSRTASSILCIVAAVFTAALV